MKKRILLASLILCSGVAIADSTENYRSAFLKVCAEEEEDKGEEMCQCVYDDWQASLPSKTEKGAVLAAKLISQTKTEAYPSEISEAGMYMRSMSEITNQCLDKVVGKMQLGGDTVSSPETDYEVDTTTIYTGNDQPVESSGKKRGLFGAVVGWAGEKAGLPDVVNEAAADKADENESTIKDKLNPLKSKFNPFKKKQEDAEAEE